VDGSDESDKAGNIYIVTEPVQPLTARIGMEGQQPGQGDEWKVWGLSRVVVGAGRFKRFRFMARQLLTWSDDRYCDRPLSSSSTPLVQARTATCDHPPSSRRLAENGASADSKC
jgi:hypothetical protein